MRSVTIDNLDIKVHERYARDQTNLESKYITESSAIANTSEISGTSVIYPSLVEQLFDLQVKNIPWALFSPPALYHLQAKRFFGHRILPTIFCGNPLEDEKEEGEEGNSEQEEQKEKEENPLLKKLAEIRREAEQNRGATETEKGTIMSLFESINALDKLLRLINARKKQYQKG